MHRPEHDAKPLTNIFNLQSPLWRIPPFLSMRQYWQCCRRWGDEYQPGATPGRSAISQGEVNHMNNTMTKQVDRTDREQYLEACRNYAAATSPMDGLALAQLAIAAIFAGMQIGEQNAARTQKGA
jgi:hypothetical protein